MTADAVVVTEHEPATCPPEVFTANIAGLRNVDAPLAETITRAMASATCDPRPQRTRDGGVNFRIRKTDGTTGWFGRTSVPSVRAAALLEQFDAGHANVLLPGVAEGTEVKQLLKRLGPHRAVFVWEPSAEALGLAMRLHDYAADLPNERLVLISCGPDDLAATLIEWLRAHPGHYCPTRIMVWPWQGHAEIAGLRSAVETAYQQVERERGQALQQLQQTLTQRYATPADDDKSQLTLATLRVSDETLLITDAMCTSSERAGCATLDLTLRDPSHVHAVARAERLANAGRQHLAILIDACREQVGDVLPNSLPAVSWYLPTARLDRQLVRNLGPDDAIAVTSSARMEQLKRWGLAAERVHFCPPPCLADAILDDNPPEPLADRPIGVMLLGDLASVAPQDYGHQLESHARIWKTAVDLIAARIEQFTLTDGEKLFARAEEKCKAKVNDPAIREEMITQLAGPVANTLARRALHDALAKAGIEVSIGGAGWGESNAPLTSWRERLGRLAEVRVAVYCDVAGEVSTEMMAAAGLGCAIVAKAPHPAASIEDVAGLLEDGREVALCRSTRDLVSRVSHFQKKPAEAAEMAVRAVARCRADHRPEQRIKTLKSAASSYSALRGNAP